MGFKVTYLNVDKEGLINFDEFESASSDKTILVSIIHANNEIGTIQDIERIGQLCKEKEILSHFFYFGAAFRY